MKLNDVNKMHYSAYVLSDESRLELAKLFVPKYTKFIGHHVTVQYPVAADTSLPPVAPIKVVGYADSKDGLEALVVSVGGTTTRSDGKIFHVTWSLDYTKYKPVDSGSLVQNGWQEVEPIVLTTTPKIL